MANGNKYIQMTEYQSYFQKSCQLPRIEHLTKLVKITAHLRAALLLLLLEPPIHGSCFSLCSKSLEKKQFLNEPAHSKVCGLF